MKYADSLHFSPVALLDVNERFGNGAHWDVQGTLDAGRWFAEALLKLESE